MLGSRMNGKRLVYLDNAATTQKPNAVIERMNRFLRKEYATVHRGIYTFSQESTKACEDVRVSCRNFLGARDTSEIIFTKGTTHGINLVARGLEKLWNAGDEILITALEHHSNIVPWQYLCEKKKMTLKVLPMNDRGELRLEELPNYLSEKTRLVAVTHISNALGTINPVKQIAQAAHARGALCLVDGAQAVSHMPVDAQDIGCDFYCFSGHKLYGPTGIGVLYGKREHLDRMDPFEFGGDMIETVRFEKTVYAKPPAKFEAGTPAFVEIVGLGAAIDYVRAVGFNFIKRQEQALLKDATKQLGAIGGLTIVGTAQDKASLVSFVLEGIHPHDVGTILNEEGIAVRAGHHCAQPVMERLGVAATTRASFAFYNTREEVHYLAEAIKKVQKVFQ